MYPPADKAKPLQAGINVRRHSQTWYCNLIVFQEGSGVGHDVGSSFGNTEREAIENSLAFAREALALVEAACRKKLEG